MSTSIQTSARLSKAFGLPMVLLLSNSFPGFALDAKDQKPAPPQPTIVQTATASGEAFGGEGGSPNSLRCPSNYVMTGISDSIYVAATNGTKRDWQSLALESQ